MGDHLLRFNGRDDRELVSDIAEYVADGLRPHQCAIVIAIEAHRIALVEELERRGRDTSREIARGRLTLLDAEESLSRFMRNRRPDSERFYQHVGALLQNKLKRRKYRHVRVYGEMVGLLWESRRFRAAYALEDLWNGLQQEFAFSLYCGYPIDVFDRQFKLRCVEPLFCAHTHVSPTDRSARLELALERAAGELLGVRRADLRAGAGTMLREGWARVPNAEAEILWLREAHPRFADTVIESAKGYFERT